MKFAVRAHAVNKYPFPLRLTTEPCQNTPFLFPFFLSGLTHSQSQDGRGGHNKALIGMRTEQRCQKTDSAGRKEGRKEGRESILSSSPPLAPLSPSPSSGRLSSRPSSVSSTLYARLVADYRPLPPPLHAPRAFTQLDSSSYVAISYSTL